MKVNGTLVIINSHPPTLTLFFVLSIIERYQLSIRQFMLFSFHEI